MSDAAKFKLSEINKLRDKLGNNDKFKYSCTNTIFINNGIINKRINKNLPIPEGWNRGRIKYVRHNKKMNDGIGV